jgi:hypothetical protein
METLQSPFVFLSYASPDRERVLEVHDFLAANGIEMWMDTKRLIAGQNWDFEIKRALDAAAVIVVFISLNSVDRTGYVQRELRIVLDKLQDRPVHRIYVIPVILDSGMPIPDQVKSLQCITISGPGEQYALLDAIHAAFSQITDVREATRTEGEIEWSFGMLKEAWDGLPGYEAEIRWPVYRSAKFPLITHVSDAIRAETQLLLARERTVKLHQEPDHFSFGELPGRRTNLLSVTCGDPIVRGRILTQHATIHWYGAGAPHGNYAVRSWVFMMDPVVPIDSLRSLFHDPDVALAQIQLETRLRLREQLEQADQSEEDGRGFSRESDIEAGTRDWDAFDCFGFEESGLMLWFPPYQVGPYYLGTVSVVIPYAVFRSLLRRPYLDALDLPWMECPDSEALPLLDWQDLFGDAERG